MTNFLLDKSIFSRLLNLNPQWGKGRRVLIRTSLDFYRADMRMRTIKIQIFDGKTLSAKLRLQDFHPWYFMTIKSIGIQMFEKRKSVSS